MLHGKKTEQSSAAGFHLQDLAGAEHRRHFARERVELRHVGLTPEGEVELHVSGRVADDVADAQIVQNAAKVGEVRLEREVRGSDFVRGRFRAPDALTEKTAAARRHGDAVDDGEPFARRRDFIAGYEFDLSDASFAYAKVADREVDARKGPGSGAGVESRVDFVSGRFRQVCAVDFEGPLVGRGARVEKFRLTVHFVARETQVPIVLSEVTKRRVYVVDGHAVGEEFRHLHAQGPPGNPVAVGMRLAVAVDFPPIGLPLVPGEARHVDGEVEPTPTKPEVRA